MQGLAPAEDEPGPAAAGAAPPRRNIVKPEAWESDAAELEDEAADEELEKEEYQAESA